MPSQLLRIPNINDTVTRLAAFAAVERLKDITGISKDTPTSYPGQTEQMAQPGSRIGEEHKNTFSSTSKVTMRVEELYRESAVVGNPVRKPEQAPIFVDDKLGISLRPIMSFTDVRISVEYRTSSKSLAEQWRNDIKVRIADNRGPQLIDLDFHYLIPPEFFAVIKHIHELRESVAGYGQDLGAYFNSHCSRRVAEISSDSAKLQRAIGVLEKQVGVQAMFDFEEPPREERSEMGLAWTISFDWLFSYHQPVMMHFVYPIVVHNQIIDDKYFSAKPYDLEREPILRGLFDDAVHKTVLAPLKNDPIGGIRIPDYDEWLPKHTPSHCSGFMNWLITVVPEDTKSLMNFTEMGNWELDIAFLAFLFKEREFVGNKGQSMIYLHRFEDKEPITDGTLRVDEDLNVSVDISLDLRTQHHLRLSFIIDYASLTQRAIHALADNPRATLMIFQSLVESLDVEYAWTHVVVNNSHLPISYIEWFFQVLRDKFTHVDWENNGNFVDWNLVQNLTIIAHRKGA